MTTRLNEPFMEVLKKLSDIMLKQGESFRARAYQKAQESIMMYDGNITSPDQLKGLPAIGETILQKLHEYVQTGTLKILEREKNNPVNILCDIYGIGPKKANELVQAGITSVQQLRQNQSLLNDIQKVGLRYYEDILKRIPRSEIDQYAVLLENTRRQIPSLKMEIVGSYRRGAQNSGDIDVILTSSNPKDFNTFLKSLLSEGIIVEILSEGPSKCLVISRLSPTSINRRVDFLFTSKEEYPFSILYFTGSQIFNTVMRHRALELGYTMNEHGLYQFKDKKKGDKVNHIFKTEKDIFDFLNMEYKEPTERTDGRAVVIIPNQLKAEIPITQTSQTKKQKFIIEGEESVYDIIQLFKNQGMTYLKCLNEDTLTDVLREANKQYYNNAPIMTDNEYDILKEYVESKYPQNNVVHEIGAPVEKNKVTLPYTMGSMDKIKPDTNALSNWKSKFHGPYVLSCKLDGVSGLYSTENGSAKLYTRGDGIVGQDISHLVPYLNLPKQKNIVLRGEFIIPKQVFEQKYKQTFANPRNMVAGIVNNKKIIQSITDLHFVAYEVIKPVMKPSEQLAYLNRLGTQTVLNLNASSNLLNNEFLSNTLKQWREKYMYEIDGVIVTDDAVYERKYGNPEHAFAFKMVLSDQVAEAKVFDVLWTPSKDGYLKPRVQIEPIALGGVRIEYATGFNGAFIRDNKVGVGALIELVRSGDVIPHIRRVIVPASQSKMPNIEYNWNDTGVDIRLTNIESDITVKEKNITGFFKGIGVEGLSAGNVSRLVSAGYDTIPKILEMELVDFMEIDGFQTKMSNKLFNGIKDALLKADLITIMSASNIFGRGFSEKKLELIMEEYPNVLNVVTPSLAKILDIKGIAEKTAENFIEKIPAFLVFIKQTHLSHKINEYIQNKNTHLKNNQNTSHPLYGKSIVFTGFRDKDMQNTLENIGAKISASVSKNTFLVVLKNLDDDTGKSLDAKKLGVNRMTPEDFKKMYNL